MKMTKNDKATLIMEVFNKKYDGDSICDLSRDIHEALDGRYNDKINEIPVDAYGFFQGTFTLRIEWKPNSGGICKHF